MKRFFYLIVFVLAIGMAYSVSQEKTPETAKPMQTGTQNPGTNDATKAPGQLDANKSATGDKTGGPDAPAVPENVKTDNEALRTQVMQQFSTQGFNNVQVAVDDGKVTLTGSVPSKEDRKRAKELAKAVPGVKSVKEKLTIDANAPAASAGTSTSGSADMSAQQNTAGSISGNTTAASGTQSAAPSASASTSTSTGSSTTGGVSGAASASTPSSTSTSGQTTGGVSGSTTTTGDAASMSGNSTPGTTAGATAGQTTGTTAATTGATGSTASETSDLQGKIENALKAEPTLSSSSVMVNVSGDNIELSGSVPSGKQKQTAKRIAQSFAGNRKVVDRITVTGNAAPSSTAPQTQPQSNPQH